MAALTKECWSWFGETAVIITRFVGATPESSRVGTLLASIIRQVCQAYGKSMDIPTEYDKLCEAFKQSIKSATPDKKLFIFLDSFEQLDPLEEAMNFKWIPDPLGDNVKMVISTTTADSIFPKLKTSLGKSPLIEIKAFTLEDATKTFEEWFSGKRTLTDIQMKIMKTALDACCLPLFLRLTFDEVYKWTSYMPVRESVLQHTIEEAIGAFFSHIEQTHGRKLVAHALGYLTLAKRGLSESELEDILSCVDEVLDELYVYWEPPVRRLPPLILVRLRSELDRYIAQREVEGTPVMLWNHHHFREVSQKRYCSDENFRQGIYQGLADFFAGTWAGDNKKPYKKKNKEGSVEDVAAKRKVAEQPLFFDDKCNFRKVNNLPWCLIATGDSEKLASECLCNLDFLLAKLEHVGIRFLLDDFVDAVEKFKNEEDFKQIKLVLQVSQRALQNDSNQLPAQLIARLRLSDGNNTASTKLKDLLEKCHKAPFPVLVSSDTQLEVSEMGLTHSLPAHTSQVVGFDLSKSGDTAITFCCDGQLKVWDIRRGQLVRSVDVPLDAFDHNTPKPNKCLLAYNDQIVVVVTEANLLLYDVNTGRNVETFSFQENHLDDPAVCVGGDAQGNELVSNAYIGVFSNSVWNLYNAKTLKKSQNRDIGSLERGRLGLESLCAGSSRFMAVTDEAHFYLRSFSIRDKLARTRRVFPIFNIPNNPDALGYQIQCMTFTSDGMTIIVANMHENEILFLDAENLEEKRRFRGYADDSPTAYCVTGDGRYVLFPSKQNVVVRGLNDENYRRSIAKHSNNVVFAATSDFNLLVTLGEDGVLRLWNDLDLKEKAWTEAEAVKEGTQIRHMELFRTTSRYAICVEVSPTTRHLSVYNLYSGRVVRRATLGPSMINIEVTVLHEDDDNVTAVVKRSCGHLCEVDLHAMKVTKELNIKVPKSEDENGKTFSILTIEQEQHLIALHYSELRIDCLEVSTGKKSNLFTSDCEAIDNFMVCESQLLLVAEVEQVFTIVDIVKKTVKHTISPDSFTDDVDLLGISADGKCLVFSGTNDGNLRCWNIVRDEPFPELDIYNDDANKEQTNDVEVEHVSFLDKETVVCSFGSGTVRICTLPTGKTKELTAGHVGEVTFSTKERSDMFLSYGSDAQDKTMVLWSKNGTEYKRVASYTSDYPLEHVVLSRDGTFVISCTVKPANVVTWHIEGKREYRSSQLHETNERELFRGTDLTLTLDLTCDKDNDVGSIDFLGDDDDRNRLVKTPDSLD
ncbi:uncharacterized protein LOC121368881 [Gigantopelta aegis]|uniref:uncharacterized protein LOC121368881 n=1 Tax=Gigantopelta aegis TaxID=1735272 RepID=UPI001B888E48|nr:uncharacterized protein LOC121368881 [Gigantopelta aegis]